MEQIFSLLGHFISTISSHLFKILIALILLWIGFKIIKKLTKIQFKLLDRNGIDGTVNNYLNHISQISLKVILIIILLGFIGISQATLAALLGASILAIGLSLKGSLANIAGGVVILLFRPFKLGDTIRTSEGNGRVENISLFYTLIITDDNKVIYVPNGKLSSSSIINLSTKDLRRVDLDVLVSSKESTDKIKEILNSLIADSPLIFPNSNIFYGVISQNGSTTTYGIRVWCKADDYSNLNSFLLDKISKLFDNGLIVPPQ
ncbi:mechanosensitive ion channel domain-containing protein [uncultured Clostridium sp.]|uniref:mechanosensitive ion channel family protein n=1 Tax=uncultured Clostridium sp. TaxID=59620 RepID=UPI00262E3778|nr:mechanosensitive ion channel domain-containing protein [uncultured Clostridium sp.]